MTTTDAAANPYLEGNFAPVTEELTVEDLPVTGAVPEQLTGRYLRNGPNPVEPVDPVTYHWFTGTGMAHGVRLEGGRKRRLPPAECVPDDSLADDEERLLPVSFSGCVRHESSFPQQQAIARAPQHEPGRTCCLHTHR